MSCFTYGSAMSWLESERNTWSDGADKDDFTAALEILEDPEAIQQDKDDAIAVINDLYWDSNQVSDQSCFGQAFNVVAYTVDPSRPMPEVRV